MKHFYSVLLLLSTIAFVSCKNKEKNTWVLDQERILTSVEVDKLDSLYKAHEKITSNEIALIIASDIPDSSILISATALGNKYGVGKKKSKNGVVILVYPKKQQVAIATGLGTEKVLKDEIAEKVIDSLMIPWFSKGEYFEAIWYGSLGIVHYLELPGNNIKSTL
jgi:uncharacterized protein